MIKPQYVDQIPKAVKGTVQQLLDKKNERNNIEEICTLLGMLILVMSIFILLIFTGNIKNVNLVLSLCHIYLFN